MIKTVEDIAKIAVPLIFLRFRSFLPISEMNSYLKGNSILTPLK